MQPIADLIGRQLRSSPDAPQQNHQAAVFRRLTDAELDPLRGAQLLETLLGLPREDVRTADEAGLERIELLGLICDWAMSLTRRIPVVLFIDDVQWADPSTFTLLARLSELAVSEPFMLLTTSRSAEPLNIDGHLHVTPMPLHRLTRDQTVAVVRNAGLSLQDADDIFDAIADRAEGVLLFAEELAAVARGSATPYTMPDSLENLLLSRLQLVAQVEPIAQVASVIGREFRAADVASLSDTDLDTFESALSLGVAHDFFFRRGSQPDVEYVFRHVLLRDAVYGSLLSDTRRLWHKHFASELIDSDAAAAAAAGARRPDLVAHHLTEAGDGAKASRWWQMAAERNTA